MARLSGARPRRSGPLHVPMVCRFGKPRPPLTIITATPQQAETSILTTLRSTTIKQPSPPIARPLRPAISKVALLKSPPRIELL